MVEAGWIWVVHHRDLWDDAAETVAEAIRSLCEPDERLDVGLAEVLRCDRPLPWVHD